MGTSFGLEIESGVGGVEASEAGEADIADTVYLILTMVQRFLNENCYETGR